MTDIYNDLERSVIAAESERISHGLTRGILFCHVDMVGKLAALQSEFAQVVAESNPPAAAPAPAQEVGLTDEDVVGYRVSLPNEPELGFWFIEDANEVNDGHLFEKLVLATSRAKVPVDLTDDEWQDISDKTGCIITGHVKEAIIAALREKEGKW